MRFYYNYYNATYISLNSSKESEVLAFTTSAARDEIVVFVEVFLFWELS